MTKTPLISFFIVIFFFSCTDPDDLGLEIQPGSDRIIISNIETQENFFSLSSVVDDSVRTDQSTLFLLGAYSDPVFGELKAGFSTQLLLSESMVDFGSDPKLDSAVLSFAYYQGSSSPNTPYYGDTSSYLNIEVGMINETLFSDSAYYSNQNFNSSTILDYSFLPQPNTYVYNNGDTIGAPLLTFRADQVGQYILDGSSDQLVDNISFTEYLGGLTIKASNINGSILYFNLNDIKSKLTIFYNDTSTFDLLMGSAAVKVNHFENQHLVPSDHRVVQSMAGYKMKVNIDENSESYKSLMDTVKGSIINRVLLNFYAEPSPFLPQHDQLTLVRSESSLYLDDLFEGYAHFGGFLEEDNKYSFNITKHFTKIVNEELPLEDLYLSRMPIFETINANRTIFTEEVELEIIFTRF